MKEATETLPQHDWMRIRSFLELETYRKWFSALPRQEQAEIRHAMGLFLDSLAHDFIREERKPPQAGKPLVKRKRRRKEFLEPL